MTTLNDVLKDIAKYDLTDEFKTVPLTDLRNLRTGPNKWNEVKDDPQAFGPEEDYELTFSRDIDKWIFWPRSYACREWCYAKFPADAPRYGDCGFILDNPQTARQVKLSAQRDNLMSRSEYDEACLEMDAQLHQGENQ